MFKKPTINLNALCNSCMNIVCCSNELIFTFLYGDSSIKNASNSSCVPTNTQSHTQKSNTSDKEERQTVCTRFKQLYLSNLSELDSCLYELFSQWPILSPPKILTFPPDSPFINYQGNLNIPLLYTDKEKSIKWNHNRPPQKYEFRLIWCWHRCTFFIHLAFLLSA